MSDHFSGSRGLGGEIGERRKWLVCRSPFQGGEMDFDCGRAGSGSYAAPLAFVPLQDHTDLPIAKHFQASQPGARRLRRRLRLR